jgi:hypothetical protein
VALLEPINEFVGRIVLAAKFLVTLVRILSTHPRVSRMLTEDSTRCFISAVQRSCIGVMIETDGGRNVDMDVDGSKPGVDEIYSLRLPVGLR